ncbi:MAG TPA: FAD-binding oxidoreductase, partial [Candidatus Dormibacteraeota bacterium]|nr:FAD-binding oxidoreductase [Candidatus Dormibacteraeota bacterium]
MRRWNGWGDESVSASLPDAALAYLRERLGEATPPSDATLDAVVADAPPSRFSAHPLLDTDPLVRVLHARGQSLPDWFALRFGRIGCIPDAVASPQTSDEVAELLAFAQQIGARVIAYGGGTSVVGHINPLPSETPVLTISLARMRDLIALDEQSRLATFGAGVVGPDLEAQLQPRGYTLGHFPQSFEYSTLGGWIATRSSGQQSLRYGRIEALFAGGRIETLLGTLSIPTIPASAAGLDIRELVLGSEGRLGIITEASVRVRPLPQHESFHGWFFPKWEAAENCAHKLVHAGVPLSMIRLANEMETLTTLRMAGNARAVEWVEKFLALRGCGAEKCLLVLGITGTTAASSAALREARSLGQRNAGIYFGRRLGDRWKANRFHGVYLRNALWEHGYAVDTVE